MVRRFTVGAVIFGACAMAGAFDSQARAAVVFSNDYTDAAGTGFFDPTFGAARQNAWVAAENVWASLLVSNYTTGNEVITIAASFANLGGTSSSAVVGSTSAATVHANFTSTDPKYMKNTIYVGALANHLAGKDLDPVNGAQIATTFNSNLDSGTILGGKTFYYGTDGNAPANTLDFESVALHEITHGLGFASSIHQDGTFQNGYSLPNAFDRFLYRGSTGTYLAKEGLDNDDERAADIISGDLYFRGPATMAVDGTNGAELYAPATWLDGTSVSHIDPSMADLLNPSYGGVNHMPSATDLAILSDMGWDVVSSVPEPASLAILGVGMAGMLVRRRR